MGIDLRAYTAEDAEACTQLYNAVFSRCPTHVPVDSSTFNHGMFNPDSHHDVIEDTHGFAAWEGGRLVGLISFARSRPENEGNEPWVGLVRALCFDFGATHAVRPLLAAATQYFANEGIHQARILRGSGGFRFQNGGVPGLPESLHEFVRPILSCGVRLVSRDLVLMGTLTGSPGRVDPRVRIEPVSAGNRWSSRAVCEHVTIGECWVSPNRLHNPHPDARSHAHLHWIGVDEQWRNRGVARSMLGWSAERLAEDGMDTISLITPPHNYNAQAFYYGVGLHPVDQLIGFEWQG